jgi:flagellar hook-basal body complex protein FliE
MAAIDPVSMQTLLSKFQAARDAMATSASGTGPSHAAGAAKPADFGTLLKDSVDRVDSQQKAAETLSARFQQNDRSVTLEDTMVAVAKANVSFQAAVQVRNKLVTAYHDIMNMPI